jgi:1-acyl-sn-glycerol-3-phosphate acyltransferase
MTLTWHSRDVPEIPHPRGPGGWLRVVRRGVPILLLTAAGAVLVIGLRPVERLLRPARPPSRAVAQAVSRASLALLGIRYRRRGRPVSTGALVANHCSWLDIFAVNAGARVTFVAKAEVAGWPFIGALARATGALFIRRHRSAAKDQVRELRDRLAAGEALIFFPEGTSTDGQRVLSFKPTLFGALVDPALPEGLLVQPVALRWEAPPGADPRFYAWWGDMGFLEHALAVLSAPRQGRVSVDFLTPLAVAACRDRKRLAAAAEAAVRAGIAALSPSPR